MKWKIKFIAACFLAAFLFPGVGTAIMAVVSVVTAIVAPKPMA